ncbi:MAG: hypothetical protein GXO66_10455 [Euryarchaeota archaeon]|nr:hypothetical protein [Euryarchaeota archaeon]
MQDIFERIRIPAMLLFFVLGVYYLLNDNFRNAILAFIVVVIWSKEFDRVVARIFGR